MPEHEPETTTTDRSAASPAGRRVRRREALAAAAAVGVAATPAVAQARTARRTTALDRVAKDLPDDLTQLGVLAAAAHLRAKRISAVELLEATEARIAKVNGGDPTFSGAPDAINAFVRLYPDVARGLAKAADRRRARLRGDAPLLNGVPIALKDLYAVKGLPLTASSRQLAGNVPGSSSVMWQRLRAAGMVLVGHAHTHEFAAGSTTDQTGNPWDVRMTVGGSSGGSAAALASHMVPAATGTDTGGSLRMPAVACGVCSIKPTHGRLPIAGIVPLSATYDHAGPMARTVADASALLAAMARGGGDLLAQSPPPGSITGLTHAARHGRRPLRGVRIAVTDRIDDGALHPDVADGYAAARKALEALGATIVRLAAPTASEGITTPTTGTIVFADVWTYHRRFAAHPERYRPAIRALVEAASKTPKAEVYVAAQETRDGISRAWEALMTEHRIDAILEPTTKTPAFPRGKGGLEGAPNTFADLTVHWDATGHPTVALPTGVGRRSRMPVGITLVGHRGGEAAVTQIAIDLQEHELEPPVAPMARA